MIRYRHKFHRADPIQIPLFEYKVVYEFRFNDHIFSVISVFKNSHDPVLISKNARAAFIATQETLELLIKNGIFDDTVIEYSGQVFSRVANDEIQIKGGGWDADIENQTQEFTLLVTYGYIPPMSDLESWLF